MASRGTSTYTGHMAPTDTAFAWIQRRVSNPGFRPDVSEEPMGVTRWRNGSS